MNDTKIELGEGLFRSELDSGIRVITERVQGTSSASLGIWINTGSRDEADGEHGISHLLEHMLFKGTLTMSARQIAETFDFMGADINAATGQEFTAIYSRFLSEHIDRAFAISMDMAMNSVVDEAELESERQVVLEEINMHNDSPDEMVHDYLVSTAWGDRPAGHSILGSAADINSYTRKDLLRYYKERYTGSRMVVAAAGEVDHDLVAELCERYSDGITSGEKASRRDFGNSTISGKYVHGKKTEQAHIAIGAKGLSRGDERRFALSVLDNILGGTMSSRLFQRIREEKGLAYSIYSFVNSLIGFGMVGVYCGTHPGRARTVIEMITEELRKVRTQGFSDLEIERARNQIRGTLIMGNEANGNRMRRIAKTELSELEHLGLEEISRRIEAVTAEDLLDVYECTWGDAAPTLAVVGPFEEDELDITDSL